MDAPDRPDRSRWWLAVAAACVLVGVFFLTRATITPVTALSGGPDFDCGSAVTNVVNGRPPSTEGATEGLLKQCRVVARKRFLGYGAMGVTAVLAGIVIVVATHRSRTPNDPKKNFPREV